MVTPVEKKEFDNVMFFLTRLVDDKRTRTVKDEEGNEKEEKRLYKFAHAAAVNAIREFCNLTAPIRASEEALSEAKKKKISLKNMYWPDQNKFDKGRKTFEYEHFWTVTDIIKLCIKADTLKKVSKILDKLEVVWILKCENKKLKKTNRENPDQDYEDANIKLVNIP
jgi:hypothetical protein